MKKFLAVLLSAIMLLSLVPSAFADEIPDKVEISFKVGDSTLIINGSPVTVETPYIEGSGTTLVPLRVITEAFGATVTWIGETKQIILDYPDVSITLQIGNTTAIVNTHTETLPVAPALSANGVTMVPLRFISETFGAEVGYDSATASITVVKESSSEKGGLNSAADKAFIGDSYYGWSMNTPAGMMMSDRSFDGRYTEFSDEDDNTIFLKIIDIDPDLSYDQDFSTVKEKFSSYTLTRADKTTDKDGNLAMHFTARNKQTYIDMLSIRKGAYYFDIWIFAELNSPAISTLTALSDSFSLSFTQSNDIRDLSTVENGFRRYTDDDLNFSVSVPAYCSLDEDSSSANVIAFYGEQENAHTAVNITVLSKSDTVTARTLATNDSFYQRKYSNPDLISVSDVFPYTTADLGDNAYYYGIYSLNLPGGDFKTQDIFFEIGDYVYNLYIETSEDSVAAAIAASFTAEPLDKNTVGVFLRNDLDYISTYTSSASGRWQLTLPFIWSEVSTPSSSGCVYSSKQTGAILYMTSYDANSLRPSDTKELTSEIYKSVNSSTTTMTKQVTHETYGRNSFYTFEGYDTDPDDDTAIYFSTAVIITGGRIYQFTCYDKAATYGGADLDEFHQILESFKTL